MFDWLDNAVIKLCNMSPVGTDLNTVKEQMNEMKVRGAEWDQTSGACFASQSSRSSDSFCSGFCPACFGRSLKWRFTSSRLRWKSLITKVN